MKHSNYIKTLARTFLGLVDSRASQNPIIEKRFESLRQWRNALAQVKGVRPFRILSNRTLRNIAESCPSTDAELLEVRGIGPAKLLQYGAEILEALRSIEL
jgi:DNA helicase II / ATP-dependent DNA helicase PcrA